MTEEIDKLLNKHVSKICHLTLISFSWSTDFLLI